MPRAHGQAEPYDIAVIDEHTSDAAGAMLGSRAIELIRVHEAQAAGTHGCAEGRAPPPRAVLISCSGDEGVEGFARAVREKGADDVWGKPFPNFGNGQMQRTLLALLRRAGKC